MNIADVFCSIFRYRLMFTIYKSYNRTTGKINTFSIDIIRLISFSTLIVKNI